LKTGADLLLNPMVSIIAAHHSVEDYAMSQLIYAIQKQHESTRRGPTKGTRLCPQDQPQQPLRAEASCRTSDLRLVLPTQPRSKKFTQPAKPYRNSSTKEGA